MRFAVFINLLCHSAKGRSLNLDFFLDRDSAAERSAATFIFQEQKNCIKRDKLRKRSDCDWRIERRQRLVYKDLDTAAKDSTKRKESLTRKWVEHKSGCQHNPGGHYFFG